MMRLTTPGQMAALAVRLRQAEAEHAVPLVQAAMRRELRFAWIDPDAKVLKHMLVASGLPCALVLSDDGIASYGPTRFPQARKLLQWARGIVLHVAGGRPEHYATAAGTTVMCGRLVVVETASGAREAEWLALIKTVAPRTPRLHITPPPGGVHPTFAGPPGATVQ